jgi:hypothetical protein
MLNLNDISQDNRFRNSGRNIDLPSMSTQQAQAEAHRLLVNKLQPSLDRAVNYLSVGGVLAAYQMGVSPRTLRRYRDLRVIDRLPQATPDLVEMFKSYGLPLPVKNNQIQFFTLGPVGIEISKMRYGHNPPSGYLGYTLERIMHDIVLNEIVLRIAQEAITYGWAPIWISEGEATLYQDNRQILKPDAMLRLKKDDDEKVFLFEYHNEDKSTRAVDKVQRYERAAAKKEIWSKAWEVETFPPVLAAFRHSIVGTGYQESTSDRETARCKFYGRTLRTVLEDTGQWFNFASHAKEFVWPWAKVDGQVA